MSGSKDRNPEHETSWEVAEARKLREDFPKLQVFWNERWSRVYGEVLEGIEEFGRHGVIAEYINRLVPKGRVLDAGCGTGILCELIDHGRFSYVGLDISDWALKAARKRQTRENIQFVNAPLESFSPEQPFEVIVFNEVLYYLDPEAALTLARSWLTESALIVVSVFGFPAGNKVLSFLPRLMQIISKTTVSNPAQKLKWTVLAGR